MNIVALCLAVLISFPIIGCTGNRQEKQLPYSWNDAEVRVDIPRAGISICLPDEGRTWELADPGRLPESISFVGVDTADQTCIMVIQPDYSGRITAMANADMFRIIHDIIGQQNGVSSDGLNYARDSVGTHGYIEFETRVAMGDTALTTAYFKGFIFDTPSQNGVSAMILTQPGDRAQSACDSVTRAICGGIKPIELP